LIVLDFAGLPFRLADSALLPPEKLGLPGFPFEILKRPVGFFLKGH
jgi:hypothetical protein